MVTSRFLRKQPVRDDPTLKIKNQIEEINKAIEGRKNRFGLEVFDAMISLGENYLPNDPRVAELFVVCQNRCTGSIEEYSDS